MFQNIFNFNISTLIFLADIFRKVHEKTEKTRRRSSAVPVCPKF